MTWNTVQTGDDTFIEDGDSIQGQRLLIGSIVKRPGDELYRVEIMNMAGDITGQFRDYNQALAFVEGVEKTFVRNRALFMTIHQGSTAKTAAEQAKALKSAIEFIDAVGKKPKQ